MITRLAFGRGLLYRTCLVRHTETYATKKVTPKRAFKPEAGSALTKEKSKRASKPEAGSSTGSDSDNDDDTLSNRITASTPLTFKQWKVYGGKIYEKRLKYLVKAKNVSLDYIVLHSGFHYYQFSRSIICNQIPLMYLG